MSINKKRILAASLALVLLITGFIAFNLDEKQAVETNGNYIKWVDFSVSASAMKKAMDADIATYGKDVHINWIEVLAVLGTKYGGNFKKYKATDMDAIIAELKQGKRNKLFESKYYSYYYEAYNCVLGGFLGEYEIEVPDGAGTKIEKKYGLKAFSPIARGYNYSHSDDFGNSRSYGFARKHLGNDLMGSIGTPIIAVESGTVEVAAWNMYGGWRIGIRSYDKKRYYYYAHLRKDKPFNSDIVEGAHVKAGDVIGYLGMTGYSTKENVNNINVPHLHFGMELIFDESQKESNNEIWIDVYQIVNLLAQNRSAVIKDTNTGHFFRKYQFFEKVE